MMALAAAAVFIAAAMLFMVQPMLTREALPLLGGTPGVWTTAMLFFQLALLVGYAAAHALSRLPARTRRWLYPCVGLLSLPVAWLGGLIGPDATLTLGPVTGLLAWLSLRVGLPFVMLSMATSTVQGWMAGTATASARRGPWALFAASNAGSLVGLLAYPLLVERTIDLSHQWPVWIVGVSAYVALIIALAIVAARRPAVATLPVADVAPSDRQPSGGVAGSPRLWIALAAVPSSLVLGVTAHLTTNVAATPMLWVIPLTVYLLTMIAAFAPGRERQRAAGARGGVSRRLAVVLAITATLALLLEASRPPLLVAMIHLAWLAAAGWCLHDRLYRSRPHPSRLTLFYLCMAIGGAIGGLFNAVLAPLLFDSTLEYPLAVAAACALLGPARPERGRPPGDTRAGVRAAPKSPMAITAIAAVLVLLAGAGLAMLGVEAGPVLSAAVFGPPLVLAYLVSSRAARLSAAVLGATIAHAALPVVLTSLGVGSSRTLHVQRTFFGLHRVERLDALPDGAALVGPAHALRHGTTLHGLQLIDQLDDPSPTPLSYYHPEGPLGDVFAHLGARVPTNARIGAIGMGVGSAAVYTRPGDALTFFEIDPAVERIARDTRLFSFLARARGEVRVVIGDGRLTLARQPAASFDLLVLDAFSSDAVPTHLLTREAVSMYLDRLGTGGVIAVHATNEFVDLPRVLATLAADLGLAAMLREDPASIHDARAGKLYSTWVVLARTRDDLGTLATGMRWEPLAVPLSSPANRPGASSAGPLWTDDRADLIGVLKW